MRDDSDFYKSGKHPMSQYSGQDLTDSEEDFIQWLARLLLENQQQIRNQPVKNFVIKYSNSGVPVRTDRTPVADQENDNSSTGMEILI